MKTAAIPKLTEEAKTYLPNIDRYRAGRLRHIVNYNNENALSRLWCEIENPVLVLCDESLPPLYLEAACPRIAGGSTRKNRKRGVLNHGRNEGTHRGGAG